MYVCMYVHMYICMYVCMYYMTNVAILNVDLDFYYQNLIILLILYVPKFCAKFTIYIYNAFKVD